MYSLIPEIGIFRQRPSSRINNQSILRKSSLLSLSVVWHKAISGYVCVFQFLVSFYECRIMLDFLCSLYSGQSGTMSKTQSFVETACRLTFSHSNIISCRFPFVSLFGSGTRLSQGIAFFQASFFNFHESGTGSSQLKHSVISLLLYKIIYR